MKNLRVVVVGLGAMGSGIGRVLVNREGVDLVGVDPKHGGRDLGDVLDEGRTLGVPIYESLESALSAHDVDLCVISTFSFTREVKPMIVEALRQGCDVVTIAEEMAYPAASEPEITKELHDIAIEEGKTILGTGINPGFILDAFILALTAACIDVKSIRARRVNDLSPFGPTVMRTQGVGTTPEEFEAGLEDGTIVGHVGFAESMHMIASALDWKLDEVIEERKPIVAGEKRVGEHITVEPGMVAGCHHTARGLRDGEEIIVLEHPQQVQPGAAGDDTGDYIEIHGEPDISLAIQPEIPGGIGTIALAVNSIAPVVAATPGMKTMADLSLPRAVLGDIKKMAETLREA